MQIEIRETVRIAAWTSHSLKAVRVSSCPPADAAKCRFRQYRVEGDLRCLCSLTGKSCETLLAGQKFYLWGVQQ